MLDYPGKLACIIWFSGCNLACRYCYNPEILRDKGSLSAEEALAFIHKRRNRLQGVVLSGGEATLYPDLAEFCREVKSFGFSVKLDTNGTNPSMLKVLLGEGLIDDIALDFKALQEYFGAVTGRGELFTKFQETLGILLEHHASFEVRTTTHSDFFTQQLLEDMVAFLDDAGYAGTYYLQRFIGDKGTLKVMTEDTIEPKNIQLDHPRIQLQWRIR